MHYVCLMHCMLSVHTEGHLEQISADCDLGNALSA